MATRLAAAAALLMMVNCMLANGALPWTPTSFGAAYGMISLALLIGAGGTDPRRGRVFARRWPRSPLW